jgi:hypothetical protein
MFKYRFKRKTNRTISFKIPYLTLVTYHYNKNEYVTRYKTCDLNRRIELLRARQKVKS